MPEAPSVPSSLKLSAEDLLTLAKEIAKIQGMTGGEATPAPVPSAPLPPPKPAGGSELARKFVALEDWMGANVLERKCAIRGLNLAALTGFPMVMIGPPGTAKSLLARQYCAALQGRYLERVLNPTSTPEEVFGPISFSALNQDRYERATAGYLPESDVVFLDEIFKGNSALQNLLLPVINEGIWVNGNQVQKLPLKLFVGASNEVPLADDRPELMALWDRFVLRFLVDYVKDTNFGKLLDLIDSRESSGKKEKKSQPPQIDPEDIAKARAEVMQVSVQRVKAYLVNLRPELVSAGFLLSDRKWGQLLKTVRANAWLCGRGEADMADLRLLRFMLWNEPDEYAKVSDTLSQILVSPELKEARTIGETIVQLMEGVRNSGQGAGDAAVAVKKSTTRVMELWTGMNKRNEDTTEIDAIRSSLDAMYGEVKRYVTGG